ncbi:hypothetical protein CBR_g333 [Chara braunii]|uniref:Uncharacterized protein n=1 Tax=Chara braunii TaxID=69332 RepID=A0A388JQG6_CHABU|nr:hypothetical protein CBR_g333 [Chara braunii]|eukprot:GBG60003.1 hypothetical protein CBR_g333 [Chara braunii]
MDDLIDVFTPVVQLVRMLDQGGLVISCILQWVTQLAEEIQKLELARPRLVGILQDCYTRACHLSEPAHAAAHLLNLKTLRRNFIYFQSPDRSDQQKKVDEMTLVYIYTQMDFNRRGERYRLLCAIATRLIYTWVCASPAERNSALHERIHEKRRNRLDFTKLTDMVEMCANKKLLACRQRRRGLVLSRGDLEEVLDDVPEPRRSGTLPPGSLTDEEIRREVRKMQCASMVRHPSLVETVFGRREAHIELYDKEIEYEPPTDPQTADEMEFEVWTAPEDLEQGGIDTPEAGEDSDGESDHGADSEMRSRDRQSLCEPARLSPPLTRGRTLTLEQDTTRASEMGCTVEEVIAARLAAECTHGGPADAANGGELRVEGHEVDRVDGKEEDMRVTYVAMATRDSPLLMKGTGPTRVIEPGGVSWGAGSVVAGTRWHVQGRSPRRYDAGRHHQSSQLDPAVRAQIAEQGKSVAVMKEKIDADRARKEEKIMRKQAKEEAKRLEEETKRLEEEERRRRERKAQRKKEKIRKEAEFRAEMRKDMSTQLAIQMSEMQKRYFRSWQPAGGTPIGELSAKTRKLCLSEKRKHGPEPVFEDSPPMEQHRKWTPERGIMKLVQLTARMTRARTKKNAGLSPISPKKRTPVKTPLSRKKTRTSAKKLSPGMQPIPTTKGALTRLRYLNAELKRLKDFDATELQRICKEEGIHYDKKVDAIFEILEHRTELALGKEETQEADVIQIIGSEVVEDKPRRKRRETTKSFDYLGVVVNLQVFGQFTL